MEERREDVDRPSEAEAGEIQWIRRPLQRLKPNILMYIKLELIENIREVLEHFGGQATIQMFRSGCFGHFLDFRGGSIARKAMHALICREVRVQDPAREGRECWFYVNGTTLRFGPSEFALVSGLQFGPSNFDPNAAHPIPPNGIFYRLFEGKKTTVTQMYDKFTDKRLPNHPPDYVKIANILVVYRILFCNDPSRAIDGWVWALVEDADAWNSFPWGGLHISDADALYQSHPQSSTGYGRREGWSVSLTWACEVFPELGRRLGVVGGQFTTPRCLKWSFSSRSSDFSRLFDGQLDIQLMVPSADELQRPYFQSSEGESVLGVRYVAPRAPSKKKLLTNVACRVIPRTCTRPSEQGVGQRTSDEDGLSDHRVSPPRASRAKRPRRTEEERSREPEMRMPGQRPGESFDSWFGRFVNAVAGAVEDRVMRRTSSAGPSSAGRAAIIDLLEVQDRRLVEAGYSEFRRQGYGASVQILANHSVLPQAFFERVEDCTELIDSEIVDNNRLLWLLFK
ncbi:hypothetical protein C2S53_003042 [Perilla frutescens var. hirtella]|uniref:DUF1985 domain-containing protein n=1 Tax=Perilla frutescens var. hirtella TaxID=608512 RepID=A0AAD4JQI3_PERFH|nr:hypothetical protein C2S53_003042 [Perilla frutescens var. hirtella]